MLIESRLRRYRRRNDMERNVGTKVDVCGETYFFHAHPELTDGDMAHVADVGNPAAVRCLLAMPEFFNVYGRAPVYVDDDPVMPEPHSDREAYVRWLNTMLAMPVAVFSSELRYAC